MFVALIPDARGQFRQRRSESMYRIVRELRIGDMTLYAVHGQPAAEAPATPDLDGVAQRVFAGGLAHPAPIDLLLTLTHPPHDPPCPIDRGALFIAGDQECDGAAVPGILADKLLARS